MIRLREYIKNLSFHYEGMNKRIKKALDKREKVPHYSCSYPYITIVDKNYPKQLLDLYDPPLIIYYQGDINYLKKDCISIIGSRKPNLYALEETETLVKQLREKHCIVSGLAYGIDVCAHKTALAFKTIAVLGCGLDYNYPQRHENIQNIIKQEHLLITEFPENVPPRRYHFPIRNRIIAALSDKIIIMSAANKSGTMHTVNIALELNRSIYCLPYRINDVSGIACNQLIQDGATMLTKENGLYTI